VNGYCFDTDVLSAALRREPVMHLVRRLAVTPAQVQATTAINAGELLYGAVRRGSAALEARVREILRNALAILPFDVEAAELYGHLRAELESAGRRLAEPDLRIASIALARDLTLVTGNVRHFTRVPGLAVENWLAEPRDDSHDEGASDLGI
jgi:tRNA(fMet)-specific endonuclease VapC